MRTGPAPAPPGAPDSGVRSPPRVPGRQVRRGARPRTHRPGAQTYREERRAGRSALLGPRRTSEAPSRPRRPGARLSPVGWSRRPGPVRRSFSPARGGGCSRAGSRRRLRAAAVTSAGPRASRDRRRERSRDLSTRAGNKSR